MDRNAQYLDAMGITRWQLRNRSAESVSADEPPMQSMAADAAPDIARMDWQILQQTVTACTQCELHAGRKQAVFGVGDRQAEWMIIGEAPGADEDAQGEPFVGRAGKLLNAMLLAIGLPREQVYIANILKCRPPRNRDPKFEEVVQCKAYLNRQIQLVAPKIILAVGRIAAHNLLNTEQTIGRLRGKVHLLSEHDIPVVVTYHPAYLLRSPLEKRKSWQDLKLARQTLNEMSNGSST